MRTVYVYAKMVRHPKNVLERSGAGAIFVAVEPDKSLAEICMPIEAGTKITIAHALANGKLIDAGDDLSSLYICCHPAAVRRRTGHGIIGDWEGPTEVTFDLYLEPRPTLLMVCESGDVS